MNSKELRIGSYYEITKIIAINIDNHVYPGRHWVIELQYVHQLQNLHFALTGKEL